MFRSRLTFYPEKQGEGSPTALEGTTKYTKGTKRAGEQFNDLESRIGRQPSPFRVFRVPDYDVSNEEVARRVEDLYAVASW